MIWLGAYHRDPPKGGEDLNHRFDLGLPGKSYIFTQSRVMSSTIKGQLRIKHLAMMNKIRQQLTNNHSRGLLNGL
jgi:hypothetical protein